MALIPIVPCSCTSIQVKDLQAAKTKTPFKTVADVDAHIKYDDQRHFVLPIYLQIMLRNLEKQVESGAMKLADEKRALQEISSAKRNRRTVEAFQADQDKIEADRQTVEELRKQLDDPEFKATSDRYEQIKAELDELKKEGDEAYAGRAKLFEERDVIQAELNVAFNKKRESSQIYRDQNDRYWAKVSEDRARRAERARQQRAAEEAQKKNEIAERLREEAAVPAFQAQIEDCQTLIDYFSGKTSSNHVSDSSPLSPRTEVAGVPRLEIRKVEVAPEGSVVRKKKNEDEDAYFVGSKAKGKGKRVPPKPSDTNDTVPASPSPAGQQLNIPLPTLSALLSLSIPPPASPGDVPRVVEDLRTKKAWFEANQSRVTAENIAKAENEIQRLTQVAKETKEEIVEPPVEPTSTPPIVVTPEKMDAVIDSEASPEEP